MYGWIWRQLPFGRPGKLIGSAVLVATVVAALWFWVFPAAEPLLPFDDVQVGGNSVGDDSSNTDDPAVSPSTTAHPRATAPASTAARTGK